MKKYFILLSDKCIPLYSGDEIYKKINEIDDNAFYFCHKGSIDRHSYLKDKSFIKIDNWYKQSQWMILKRETVNFFLKNDYIDIFSNSKLFAPDEHYFINIIKKFNISLTFHGVSHVNWKESEQFRRPKTYYILTNEIIENILKSKCLFMRKVSSECELPSYFDKISNKK